MAFTIINNAPNAIYNHLQRSQSAIGKRLTIIVNEGPGSVHMANRANASPL